MLKFLKSFSKSLLFIMISFFIFSCAQGASMLYAITQNPIIGRASGKFSNAIFYKNYDANVIRSKPIQIMDKKSDPQLEQRSWFTDLQAIVGKNLYNFKVGFAFAGNKMSAYNYAMAQLFKAGSELSGTVRRGVAASFAVSCGQAAETPIGTVTHVDAQHCTAIVTVPTDELGTRVAGTWYVLVIERRQGIDKSMFSDTIAINTASATQTLSHVLDATFTGVGPLAYFVFYVCPTLGVLSETVGISAYKSIPAV
jgi:hypothetical protein